MRQESEWRTRKETGLIQAYRALKTHGPCKEPERILVIHHDFGRQEAQECLKVLQGLGALLTRDAKWTIDESKERKVLDSAKKQEKEVPQDNHKPKDNSPRSNPGPNQAGRKVRAWWFSRQ